jgi:hypothetical protein
MEDNQTKHNKDDEQVIKKKKEYPKMICSICGSTFYRNNKLRHERSKRHNDVKYLWIEKFEIIR